MSDNQHPNDDSHRPDRRDGRARLRLVADVAEQLAGEAGLDLTADLADLVTIAYVGLLDTPAITDVTHPQLLRRCRHNLIVWAWEQGNQNLPLPRHTSPPDQPRAARTVGLRAVDHR